jgi:hypothetical protein
MLDFLMPNGKTMRECTFGYVRKLGGRFAAIRADGQGQGNHRRCSD